MTQSGANEAPKSSATFQRPVRGCSRSNTQRSEATVAPAAEALASGQWHERLAASGCPVGRAQETGATEKSSTDQNMNKINCNRQEQGQFIAPEDTNRLLSADDEPRNKRLHSNQQQSGCGSAVDQLAAGPKVRVARCRRSMMTAAAEEVYRSFSLRLLGGLVAGRQIIITTLIIVTVLSLAATGGSSAEIAQAAGETQATGDRQATVVAIAHQIVANISSDMSLSSHNSTANQQSSPVAVEKTAAKLSDAAEVGAKLKPAEETLLASESRQEEQQPEVASNSRQQQPEATTTAVIEQQQQQQQQEEASVPTVSGLISDEVQTATPAQAPEVVSATSNQQVQQSLVTEQQLLLQNDVAPNGLENFGRKSASPAEQSATSGPAESNQQQQTGGQQAGEWQQNQSAQTSSTKVKSRSLKRAFGGHLGVFGRKRPQSSGGDQATGSDSEQQTSFGFDFAAPAPAQAKPARHSYHYYYQQPEVATRAPSGAGTTRTLKLKEADFPDYREILVQPDKAEVTQQQQVQQQQEQSTLTTNEQDLARNSQQSQQQQQVEEIVQQKMEQTHMSDAELNESQQTETTTAAQVIVQQQQEVAQQQEVDPATATSGNFNLESSGQSTAGQQPGAPFIRLSNIATIGGNATGSGSGNSSQGVKLMRIYVIDLDQKLVVGGGGSEQQQPGEQLKSVQYTLPDGTQQATVTQSAPSADYSGRPIEQQEQQQLPVAEQITQAPIAEHQQTVKSQSIIPEGYVLLDRDSLQGNLSQMFAKLGPQYDSSSSSLAAPLSPQQQQHQHQTQQVQQVSIVHEQAPVQSVGSQNYSTTNQYQPPQDTPLGLWSQGQEQAAYVTTGQQANASITPMSHTNKQQPEVHESYGSRRGANYSTTMNHSAQPLMRTVSYPEHQQQQPQVPQYIAPQYASNNPEVASATSGEWPQAYGGQQQASVSGEHPGYSRQQQSIAPASNYTGARGSFVQAAGSSVARHKPQEEAYSNNYSYLQQADNPESYSNGQSYHSAAASSGARQTEPAPIPLRAYNGLQSKQQQPQGSDQWRPVDYSAPPLWSRPQQPQPQVHFSQQQLTIGPAQFAANSNANSSSRAPVVINGLAFGGSDHDVVSLNSHYPKSQQQAAVDSSAAHHQRPAPKFAAGSQVDGSGSQVDGFGHHHNNESSASPFDAFHAPPNYPPEKSAFSKQQQQVVYVNSRPQAEPSSASGSGSYQQQPKQSAAADQAPSYRPPSPFGQLPPHNGTIEWPQTGDQAADQYNQAAHQRQPLTNEYPDAKSPLLRGQQASYAPAELAVAEQQQQYGTNPLAAYGNQQPQAKQLRPSASSESSSLDGAAQEIPLRPAQTNMGYRQRPSAYLAVNGPPVADGVYAEHPPPAASGQPAKRPAASGQRPARPRAKGQSAPGAKGRPRGQPGGGRYKPVDYAGAEGAELYQPPEVAAQTAAGQYAQYYREPQQQQPRPSGGFNYQQPRQPQMVAMSNYYRAPPGVAKGLLSWETITSVASGAAKRLPSLSSILSPFTSNQLAKGQLYPTANYQQQPPHGSYPKSAHFDRDVANFHRPYPLRHMSQGSGYQDNLSQAASGNSEQAADQAEGDIESHDGGDQQDDSAANSEGGYEVTGSDLSSLASASAQHGSGESLPFAPQDSSSASTESEIEHEILSGAQEAAAEQQQQQHTGERYPNPQANHTEQAEVLDLADIDPKSLQRPTSGQQAQKQQSKSSSRRPPSPKNPPSADEHQLEPAQAAVLSSIEQQLSTGSHRPPPKRKSGSRQQKSKLRPSASGNFMDSPEFMNEPAILTEHKLSFESLPADQQRLLMGGGKRPAQSILYPEEMADGGRRPLGSGPPLEHPQLQSGLGTRPLSGGQHATNPSMQIGQFKITPQTQFVQSIIEPSRQMFGQYFKQYIGHLGQSLG